MMLDYSFKITKFNAQIQDIFEICNNLINLIQRQYQKLR